jgi:hypothetical protein
MLSQQWEPLAEKIANVEDLACFQDFINELATFTEVSQMDQRPVVFIGKFHHHNKFLLSSLSPLIDIVSILRRPRHSPA